MTAKALLALTLSCAFVSTGHAALFDKGRADRQGISMATLLVSQPNFDSHRTPAGHPEGYLEAFANIYKNFANAIRARLDGRKPAPGDVANDYPKIEDGVRGMAFIEAVVNSSKRNAAWTKPAV